MTTMEVVYRYGTPPTERVAQALARTSDVYGIRRLAFDSAKHMLRVEFDATRLKIPAVAKLLLNAGLDLLEELSPIEPPAPEAAPTPAA